MKPSKDESPIVWFSMLMLSALSVTAFAQVSLDTIPNSRTLPKEYPESWIIVHDFNYPTMVLGAYIVIDVAAESDQVKGQFQGAQFAGFDWSKTRGELYVAETYYEYVGYGPRRDVITIYDHAELRPIGRIPLSGNKRALMTPRTAMTRLTGNERFLLLYNFTPAASVTVVDMDQRTVASEIPIPGCTFIYPYADQSFFSLCGDGSMAYFTLGTKGEVTEEGLTGPFNDIDNDAMYMTPGVVKQVFYFPTQLAKLQPINMTGAKPQIVPSWSLVSVEEAKNRWRPVKRETVDVDDSGKLYILMHRVEEDGSHIDGTTEVWSFDRPSRSRINRFSLRKDASALAVTGGESPYVVLISGNRLDVYDAGTGAFVREIGGWWDDATTFQIIHANR